MALYLNGERVTSANQLEGRNVTETAPSEGDALVWNVVDSEYAFETHFEQLDGGAADTSYRFTSIGGGDATTTNFNTTYFCGDATTY